MENQTAFAATLKLLSAGGECSDMQIIMIF